MDPPAQSSTVDTEREATIRPQPVAVRTPKSKDGSSAAASSAPKIVSTPVVCQDGRELYLGSTRKQVMSGLFCLLLLFVWLAIVLAHIKRHADAGMARSSPSHLQDFPLPAEGPERVYAALVGGVEGVTRANEAVRGRKNTTTAARTTDATVRRRALTVVTTGWDSFDLRRRFVRNRTVAPSYSRQEMEDASERRKVLWCVYNGSDARFAPRHLPRHLCSAVVLCCITLSAPSGEPSATDLHFPEFLQLRYTATVNRPDLIVALGGPQQDYLVLRSLVHGKRRNATLRLAVHLVHFMEFNRLDGVLLYTLQCGPDTVTVFRALHERLEFGGYTAAVTCPEDGEGRRLFADASLGPVVLIPPQVNESRTQCPVCLARRGALLDEDVVMLGVRLSGARYKLPPGVGSTAQEGAIASLVGSAAYRDVCLAIRDHGWSGYSTPSGECVVACRNRTWMAAPTPWALGAAARLAGRYSGVGAVILDVDADDVRGVCGSQTFPLTDALHRLLQ